MGENLKRIPPQPEPPEIRIYKTDEEADKEIRKSFCNALILGIFLGFLLAGLVMYLAQHCFCE